MLKISWNTDLNWLNFSGKLYKCVGVFYIHLRPTIEAIGEATEDTNNFIAHKVENITHIITFIWIHIVKINYWYCIVTGKEQDIKKK